MQRWKMMDGQIRLNDIFPEIRRFDSKSCAATLEVCTHEPGICAERCCQYCNMPCGSRCGYSIKQPEVKVGNVWMKNPDFRKEE